MKGLSRGVGTFLVFSLLATPVAAQDPPVPPEVVTRDGQGHATLRTTRLTSPLTFDGRLDDPIYTSVPAASGFVQQEPTEGAPASDKTELWVFFDDQNIYVGARLWETHPDRRVTSDMRPRAYKQASNKDASVIVTRIWGNCAR